ncbi:hypothetical protein HK102_009914, partial [Quaeritorhiza haematococci]
MFMGNKPPPGKLDLGNPLSLHWKSLNGVLWANPPLFLIPQVLKKVVKEQVSLLLVVPFLPDYPFFPQLWAMSCDFPLRITCTGIRRGFMAKPVLPLIPLQVAVFHLSTDPKRIRAFRRDVARFWHNRQPENGDVSLPLDTPIAGRLPENNLLIPFRDNFCDSSSLVIPLEQTRFFREDEYLSPKELDNLSSASGVSTNIHNTPLPLLQREIIRSYSLEQREKLYEDAKAWIWAEFEARKSELQPNPVAFSSDLRSSSVRDECHHLSTNNNNDEGAFDFERFGKLSLHQQVHFALSSTAENRLGSLLYRHFWDLIVTLRRLPGNVNLKKSLSSYDLKRAYNLVDEFKEK